MWQLFLSLFEKDVCYIKVSYEGSYCIMTIKEAVSGGFEDSYYTFQPVFMTERQFKNLPEFTGF